MIKHVKRLLPAMLALLLAGCAAIPQDAPTSRYKVALIAKSTGMEFWNSVFTGAQAAATEYNIELTVTAPDDEEDYKTQNTLIEDAVADGAKAIIFSAIDYEANAAAIDAAAAAGVTVISVDSAVNSDHVAAYIGADNYGAGRMAAQSALDGMEGALCVGLINYEVNGANGRDREQGARDAFAESGRARITAAVSTHPNAASARADTLAMLRTHPEINVLIALNETTAVGAAQAVQQMQRADDLWLAAFDSNIETIDALQTGAVDALIVQNTYGMGYFGVESAYKLLAGQGSSYGVKTMLRHADGGYYMLQNTVSGGEQSEESDALLGELDALSKRIDTDALRAEYGTSNIGVLYFLPVGGTSFAMVHYADSGEQYYYEYACLYRYDAYSADAEPENPATYAHEILHLFGAPDLYEGSTDAFVDDALLAYIEHSCPNDIMHSTYDADGTSRLQDISQVISPLTAYCVGLADSCPELAMFPALADVTPGVFGSGAEPEPDELPGAVAA